MVLGRAWRFIKRHRGKLALGGALVGGGAYLLHWWWLSRSGGRRGAGQGDDEVTALLSELERAQFLRSTGRNCTTTVAALLPGIAAQLDADFGVEQITAELRAKPAPDRRAELCDQLRARAFARLLASVYAACGSLLCAHVQLHLLAGLLCQQKRDAAGAAVNEDGDASDGRNRRQHEISEEVKIRFLGLLDTRSHVSDLAGQLESHCLAECAGLDVREKFGLRRLDSLLHRLRVGFEAKLQAPESDAAASPAPAARLLPSLRDSLMDSQRQLQREAGDDGRGLQRDDLLLQRLCSEADARLRSVEAGRVLKQLLDSAGMALLRVFTAHYQGLNSDASLHERTLPLLKVLPLINSTAALLLSRQFLDTSGLADNAGLLRFSADLFDSLGGSPSREMS
ncbi:hypothetical protein BOX15_Mlig020871g1 [Macrostomum lignano]|uniref:Peroxisomal biogenesis factor 3 n=2 Tax=Macrostomum lignano TaxID=282301 RepID=A0A267GB20_9PLAT|nr:hypothetical protein BOX15_Mlig020871g1 [Macrostomum lignano]